MGNLLYFVALILIIFWTIGFFACSVGAIIHMLLLLALIAILLKIIRDK